jgi:hypothetical protein
LYLLSTVMFKRMNIIVDGIKLNIVIRLALASPEFKPMIFCAITPRYSHHQRCELKS